MSERATVTATEIAKLAGVGRAAVSNWRRRHQDFPQPVGGAANSPVFDLAEVEAWLRTQGKLQALAPEDLLWHRLDSVPGGELPGIVALAGWFLRYLANSPDWPTLAEQADAAVARHLTREIRRLADEHMTVTPAQVPVLRAVADLAAERGVAATFEHLLDRYQAAVSRREFVTPPELADLMVSLAGVEPGRRRSALTVLDPACGTGTLLATVFDRAPYAQLVGQEINVESATLASIRLALAGARAKVVHGDALLADGYPELAADVALCDPPFALRNWGYDDLTYDSRWEYGTPPRAESELAWVQHCLARVTPGGTVVVVMPASAASRGSGRRIRAQLLRRGALRAVIGLPAGTLTYTAIPVHLWLLRRPAAETAPGHVLLVDATEDGVRARAVEWDRIGQRVIGAWRAFQQDPESVDEPGIAAAVPVVDLLDEEVDLTPSRRLVPPLSEAAGPRFADLAEELAALAAKVPGLIPRLAVADAAASGAISTVGELAKLGALTVHTSTLRHNPDPDAGPVRVLTARDVVTRSAPSGSLAADQREAAVPVEPGDVVVPVVAREIAADVVTEGGAVLGSQVVLIRPDPEVFDPWFVAGFLRTSENLRQSSSMGSFHRIDVRRARLPRLPLAEQRRYAEVFRRLADLERCLTRVAQVGGELRQAATDGIAAGVLRPEISLESD